jgi:hypothetical protein
MTLNERKDTARLYFHLINAPIPDISSSYSNFKKQMVFKPELEKNGE